MLGKTRKFFLGALFWGLTLGNSSAQTPAVMHNQINTQIVSGIPGGITAFTLNQILNNLVNSYSDPTNIITSLGYAPLNPANNLSELTSYSTAFNRLSPMTTAGDLIYGGVSGAGTRLPAGTSTQVLIGGTIPTWGSVNIATMVSGLGAGVAAAASIATNANGGFPTVSVSATAPSTPSLFQPWLNTTATPYVYNIWTGAWTAIGTLDPTTHAFTSPTLDLAATPSGGFGGVSGNLPIANMPQIGASTFLCNSTGGATTPTACAAGSGFLAAAANSVNGQNGVVVSKAASGQWYPADGATVLQLNDRFLLGGASANDGAYPFTNLDWLSAWQNTNLGIPGAVNFHVLSALTPGNSSAANGAGGILAGAQSLYSASALTASIGISSYALNNNATYNTSAWGFYGECHGLSNTGACMGMEIDVSTRLTVPKPNPYAQALIVGHQIGCGADVPASELPCGAAVQIVANLQPFKVGINFLKDALFGDDGVTPFQTAVAISMANGHQLEWTNGTQSIHLWSYEGQQLVTDGTVYLSHATAPNIAWANNGLGAPTFTTKSVGEKITLYNALSGSAADYAIGVLGGELWLGVPTNANTNAITFYGGTKKTASIDGVGTLTLEGATSGNLSIQAPATGSTVTTGAKAQARYFPAIIDGVSVNVLTD